MKTEKNEKTEKIENSDSQARILGAALTEFACKGKGGARMQAIADRAEVNKALLHYYFRSKDDLYRAVLRHFFQRVLGEIKKIEKIEKFSLDVEGSLRLIVDTYMGLIRQHPEIPKIVMRELLDGETLEEFIESVFEEAGLAQVRDLLVGHLNVLKARNVLRDVDPRAAIVSLIGSMLFYFIGHPVIRFNWPEIKVEEDVFFESYKDTVVTLLLNGLLKEGKK